MKTTQTNETPRKRFNIVDFAIIAIVILAVLIVAWKLISARNAANVPEAEEDVPGFDQEAWDASPRLRFTVEVSGVPVAAAENALESTETQIFNANKRWDAFITDAYSVPTAYTVTAEDGTVYDVVHPETCRMFFTVESLVDLERYEQYELYTIGNQEIRIGKSYILKTVDTELNGTITSMEIVNE